MFIIVQRRLFLINCSYFLVLTFINCIINLNADCLPYICIAILQNNLKHYIMRKDFIDSWFLQRRPQFVDREKNSFEVFLDELVIGDCFPENEYLAKKIIDVLKQKYNLIF